MQTPEHALRVDPAHVEIQAAYAYVDRVADTADCGDHYPAWHGWALREAFLAGISYAQRQADKTASSSPT